MSRENLSNLCAALDGDDLDHSFINKITSQCGHCYEHPDTMRFENKVVIVTGASAGIGAAIALLFAEEGAQLTIVGRNETRLNQQAENCSKVGKKPLAIKADVCKDEDLKKIVDNTVKAFGKIDVLVNNAGIFKRANVADDNLVASYDDIFNTNLRSVFTLTSLSAPYLIKTKGNIVNISSVAAIKGFPGFSAYSASKAGLNQFSKVSALEFAEHGVRVNVVSPGPVETDIFDGSGYSIESIKDFTSLKKISQPNEIADVVAFLASDKAGSITGSDYLIDCGFLVKT